MTATVQPPNLKACTPFEWTLIIRRIDIPAKHRKVKLVAYTLATYANFSDGKSVRPGLKRLALDTGYSERWVQESLKLLRESWLLYRLSKGSKTGKVNLVDVHQLCAPADWEARFPLIQHDESEPEPDPWAPQ